jgi:hypothetical protein
MHSKIRALAIRKHFYIVDTSLQYNSLSGVMHARGVLQLERVKECLICICPTKIQSVSRFSLTSTSEHTQQHGAWMLVIAFNVLIPTARVRGAPFAQDRLRQPTKKTHGVPFKALTIL